MKNNNYCTFYIVRHGETDWNVKRIIQGQTDIDLTENGIMQAKQAAEKLKKIKFDEAFSSDLRRAKRTAEIITLEKKMAIKTTHLLREKYYGKHEGKDYMVYEGELKKHLEKYESLTDEDRWKYKYSDVESDEDVASRFITFLREVAVAYGGKNVLIATHNGVISNFLVHLGLWEYKDIHVKKIKNAGYIKIKSDGIDFFVEKADGVDVTIPSGYKMP